MGPATLALLSAVAAGPGAVEAQTVTDLAGCWTGAVGSGGSTRPAVLELSGSDADGAGAFTVLRGRADSRSIAGVVVADGSLSFEASGGAEGETLRGMFALDNEAMTGVLVSEADSTVVTLARAVQQAEADTAALGVWRGVLDPGFPMALVLRFRSAPCSQTHLTMDSPDQGATDLPATALRLVGDSVHFEMAYLEATFRGTLDRHAGVIAGTWTQRGTDMPLRVERTAADDRWGRPQDPQPPLPYRVEEVGYDNDADSVHLAGTLTLPEGIGPFPAVLLLSGSGPQDRDETIAGHRPFLVIADHLTRSGIAVLRVDDRGVGGSTGSVLTSTIDDNAGDALAGIAYLRARSDIDADRIGLIGHSEGGYVGPLAATRSDDVAFVIMLAGPAVPVRDLLITQQEALARAADEPDEVIDARRTVTEALFDVMAREPIDSIARIRMRGAVADLLDSAAQRRREVVDSLYGNRGEASLDVMLTPWFRYLLAYDPGPALRALRVPLLALYGDLDLQVPADPSVQALERLRTSEMDSPVTVRVFPQLNHLFQHATTGLPAEYIRIEETIAPAVLRAMSEWITAATDSRE